MRQTSDFYRFCEDFVSFSRICGFYYGFTGLIEASWSSMEFNIEFYRIFWVILRFLGIFVFTEDSLSSLRPTEILLKLLLCFWVFASYTKAFDHWDSRAQFYYESQHITLLPSRKSDLSSLIFKNRKFNRFFKIPFDPAKKRAHFQASGYSFFWEKRHKISSLSFFPSLKSLVCFYK